MCYLFKNNISNNDTANKLQTLQIEMQKNQLVMANGLIVNIPIGSYDGNTAVPNYELKSLEEPVSAVIDGMRQFADDFQYKYLSLDDKTYWTEQRILSFLRDDVGTEFFHENGSPKYDGLIVCITSYGDERHVLSSDYQVMEKRAIHRIISNKYAAIRDFPRIFIFDTCAVPRHLMTSLSTTSVNRQMDENTEMAAATATFSQHVMAATSIESSDLAGVIGMETQSDHSEMSNENVVTKNTKLDDVRVINEWTQSTKNPDYNLVTIDSVGDTSISNVTHFFTERVRQNVANQEGMGLSDVMENIRADLRQRRDASFVPILNNKTSKMVIHKKGGN